MRFDGTHDMSNEKHNDWVDIRLRRKSDFLFNTRVLILRIVLWLLVIPYAVTDWGDDDNDK
tara:strand:- start:569 stop:751 length:183 start_codon:yes stop_codon:yes gene_type:complete